MRSSFFITSGENQILYIVQCFGLALFVQLVEVVQQGSLGGGENGVVFFWLNKAVRDSFYGNSEKVTNSNDSCYSGSTNSTVE